MLSSRKRLGISETKKSVLWQTLSFLPIACSFFSGLEIFEMMKYMESYIFLHLLHLGASLLPTATCLFQGSGGSPDNSSCGKHLVLSSRRGFILTGL